MCKRPMNRIYSKDGETLDDLFKNNEYEIYNQVFKSIKENYKNVSNKDINVISISTKDINYSINLKKEKFSSSLKKCIDFFEKIEEYEKCQECLNIINEIKVNKQESEYGIS